MFTQKVSYTLPQMTAEAVLWALVAQTRTYMTSSGSTFAWSNIFIEKLGGTVFVEVRINEETAEVEYLVGCNPDENTDYPLYDYRTALRELRGFMHSQVIF